MLAERFHWTPEQISRLDPDYLEELLTKLRAQSEHADDQERRKALRDRMNRLRNR